MEKGLMNNKTFLKILSLVVAVVLWRFVVTTEEPTRSAKISDIEVMCSLSQAQLDNGLNIISKSDDSVDFVAKGKRSLVIGDKKNYFARLNLDNITQPGRYSISPEISSTDGVEIKDIQPEVIEVYVDKNMTSLVPVKVVQKNNLADGFVLSNIEAAHSQLTVTMPSLAIEELAYVGLEIDMSQIKESCTVMCPVTYCNSDGRQIAEKGFVNTDKIAVSITLERRKTVDIYTDIRVNGALPEDCELEPSFTQIEIYGNSEAVNAIDRLSTEPLVFDRVPQVGEEFFVKIILPEGVHLNDGTSDKVKITMKNKNE